MDREILQRYVEGDVTNDEVEVVVNWLNEDEKHVQEYMKLHKLYDITLFNNTENFSQEQTLKSRPTYFKIGFELLKIAIVALIILGISFYLNTNNDEVGYQSVFAPAGQRAEVILPDSTKVWLNAKSKITYPIKFAEDERRISLEGEAYFDVVHDEQKKFVVHTKQLQVEVLGTEFNVHAYENSPFVEVALLEGSVELIDDTSKKTYRMKVNEKARLQDGKLFVSEISEFDYYKWKEGLLCFTNESVELIMKKLELHFDVTIQVQKTGLLSYRYSGKFRIDDGVEQILKVLQLEHQFTYTRNTNLNLITIK